MENYRIKRENINYIKNGFINKISGDDNYRADIPHVRFLRMPVIAAIIAAVILRFFKIRLNKRFDAEFGKRRR